MMIKAPYRQIFAVAAWLWVLAAPAIAQRLTDQTYLNLRALSQAIALQAGPEAAIRVLGQYAGDPRVLALLRELYRQTGNHQEFMALVRPAYVASPGDKLLQELYLDALAVEGFADSVRLVSRRLIEADSTDLAGHLFVGNKLRSYGMFQDALTVFRSGRTASGRPETFSREMAETLIEMGDFEKGVDELLVFIRSNPGDTGLAKHTAYRIFQSGDEGRGVLFKRLEKEATRADGEYRVSLLGLLMDLYLSAGRSREACVSLAELLPSVDRVDALRYLTIFIHQCIQRQELEAALLCFGIGDSLGLIAPESSLLGRAETYLKLERYGQAEQALLELFRTGGQERIKAEAARRLGDLYLDYLKQPGRALEYFRKLEELDSKQGQGLYETKLRIVESFIRLERLDEAEKLCRELVEGGSGDHSGAMLLLSDVMFYSGRPDSAAAGYKLYARLKLGEPAANDALEKVYLIMFDRDPAKKLSEMVGRALYDAQCGKVQQARDRFAEILRQDIDSLFRAEVYYQMGRMYENAAEYSLALGAYGQISADFPKHQLAPLAELRMGLILLEQIGDREGARKHLERVVFEYPNGVATPEARRLLRSLEEEKL